MKRHLLATLALAGLAMNLSAQTQEVTVLEYHAAPGQFVNDLPEAKDGDTHDVMCARCTEMLNDGGMIHLGTYGGYVTVRFDHPVKNLRGSDLRIKGNGFYSDSDPVYGSETIGGSFEPGIVYEAVCHSEDAV